MVKKTNEVIIKPMTKKEIRKVANQSILNGKTKQEIFEALKETSYRTPEDLAKIIRTVPSLQARKKYKALNITLIVIFSLTILFLALAGISSIISNEIMRLSIVFIWLIVYIALLIGVTRYKSGSYWWIALCTILGLIRFLGIMLTGSFTPLSLIDLAIHIGVIWIGLYLHSKLFPAYLTVKERYQDSQGQSRIRNVIKFED